MSSRGVMSGRHQAAQQIKTAVAEFLKAEPQRALRNHNHAVDDHAREVLERLGGVGRNSDRMTAAEAIVSVLPPEAWAALFADCIIAEWKARSHKQWRSASQADAARAPAAEKSLRDVARYIGWEPQPFGGASPDPEGEALAILRVAIDIKRRQAEEHLRIYSRTTTREAARAIGIGWIRDTLDSIGHRYGCAPEPRHIAAIATAALGMGDVTADMVDKAPRFAERLRDPTPRVRGVRN